MKYFVLDGFAAVGGDVYPGDVIELSERDAHAPLSVGRIRVASDAEAAANDKKIADAEAAADAKAKADAKAAKAAAASQS